MPTDSKKEREITQAKNNNNNKQKQVIKPRFLLKILKVKEGVSN